MNLNEKTRRVILAEFRLELGHLTASSGCRSWMRDLFIFIKQASNCENSTKVKLYCLTNSRAVLKFNI